MVELDRSVRVTVAAVIAPIGLAPSLATAQCGEWVQVAGSAASPPFRLATAMAYDPLRGQTVLFGGSDPSEQYMKQWGGGCGWPLATEEVICLKQDTWEWDGTAWALASNAGLPSSRGPLHIAGAGLVFNSLRGRVQTFGGVASVCSPGGCPWAYWNNARVYEWTGGAWVQLSDYSGWGEYESLARHSHSIAFDETRGVMMVHGGGSVWLASECEGLWCPWSFGSEPTQSGLEWNGAQFVSVSSPPINAPYLYREDAGLVYDKRRQVPILFGGGVHDGTSIQTGSTHATWALIGGEWTRKADIPGFDLATGCYHDALGAVLRLSASCSFGCAWSTEMYSWDLNAWVPVGAGAPSEGHGSPGLGEIVCAYDSARQRVVAYWSETGSTYEFVLNENVLRFAAEPPDTVAVVGADAAFTANVTGSAPSFKWHKDGVLLADQPGRISGATTSTLTVLAVQPSDAGGYACYAWNGCGNVQTRSAILSVSACGTSDFNGDGDFGTDADIEAFFACLGGSCCATCYSGGSDFNGDGDFGTDADIESFFRVLGGGAC